MDEMLNLLKKRLAHNKNLFEQKLRDVNESLEILATMPDDSHLSYRIELFDGWPGEKSVSVQSAAPLRDVMKRAITKYKKVNNRSDVQARCVVIAIVPDTSVQVSVPNEMWRPHFKEFGTYDPKK